MNGQLEPIKANNKFNNFISKILPKILAVFLVFGFGVWIGQNVTLPFAQNGQPIFRLSNGKTPKEIQVNFEPFWLVWDKITTDYIEKNKIDPQKLLYGAISGMVEAIGDPYTVFLDPTENKEFELALSGTYEGVGIELDSREGKLSAVAAIDGSPASKAGVQAGDRILEIDGVDTTGITIQDAVKKIRGKAGTKVNLKLQRSDKNFDISLIRDKIVIKSVELKDLGGGVAQVKLARFGDNTSSEWNQVVSQVVTGGFKKVILDMRNNPGGRLDYAVEVAGEFVTSGSTILLEEEASGKRQPLKTTEAGGLQNLQLVILLNKGSASASEIVAGALRDLKSVKIIGETSFGKGTIQRVDELPDGSGLHITFAKWLTPNGTWVHKTGLKPDIEIKLTDEDRTAGRDSQLDRAKEFLK